MKVTSLPFQLGMEYENWEFDLMPIKTRIKNYDSYVYTKKIQIGGISPQKIELIFHWEILVAVILEFEKSDLPKVEKLIQLGYTQVNQTLYLSNTKIHTHINKTLLC